MKASSGRLFILGTGVAALVAAVGGAMLANSKLAHRTATAPVMAAPQARAGGASLRLSDYHTTSLTLRDGGTAGDVTQGLASPAAAHQGVTLAAPAPAFGRPVEIGRNGTTNPPAHQR